MTKYIGEERRSGEDRRKRDLTLSDATLEEAARAGAIPGRRAGDALQRQVERRQENLAATCAGFTADDLLVLKALWQAYENSELDVAGFDPVTRKKRQQEAREAAEYWDERNRYGDGNL
jgi:hypothetical protein